MTCHGFKAATHLAEEERETELAISRSADELFAGGLGKEAIFWNDPSGIISSQLPLLTWELVVISKNSP